MLMVVHYLFISCSLPVHFLLALNMKQTDLPVKHRLLKSTDWLWAVSGWWSSSGVPATHWSGDLSPPTPHPPLHPFCWRSRWPWGLGGRVLLVTRGAALSGCVSAAPSHSSVCSHNSTTVCCRFPLWSAEQPELLAPPRPPRTTSPDPPGSAHPPPRRSQRNRDGTGSVRRAEQNDQRVWSRGFNQEMKRFLQWTLKK